MRHIYTCTVDGELRLTFSADLADGSSPIRWDGDEGEDRPTVFQAADARSPRDAAELLNEWLNSEGGAAWEDGEPVRVTEY